MATVGLELREDTTPFGCGKFVFKWGARTHETMFAAEVTGIGEVDVEHTVTL